MINDLDKTLMNLLAGELPGDMAKYTITFAAPGDQFPPTSVILPAVDLFLYDVRENRELRTSEWTLERGDDGTDIKKPAPVRVDCSYLITAWVNATPQDAAQAEHRILGEVMRVIIRNPVIPSKFLAGRLRGQEPDMPAVSILPGHLQSLAEFWQALGGKPKAALNYRVTMALELFDPKPVNLVTDKVLQFGDAAEGQRYLSITPTTDEAGKALVRIRVPENTSPVGRGSHRPNVGPRLRVHPPSVPDSFSARFRSLDGFRSADRSRPADRSPPNDWRRWADPTAVDDCLGTRN